MDHGVLINASNLHVGGGVQVAVSVLSELDSLSDFNSDISIAMSSQVASFVPNKFRTDENFSYVKFDVFGLDIFNSYARKFLDRYASVFTLFGPLYRWRPPFINIVGFAQPWIIYPDNEVYGKMKFFERLRTRFKFWMQAQFFKRADILVVELDHVKEGLVRELGINPERIHVIHNCVSRLYQSEAQWLPLLVPATEERLLLGYLGRNYRHKNTAILPLIVRELYERHNIKAKVVVAFTDEEWHSCSLEFREACINVGPLAPAQCPNFYCAVDAVVFPSLLECFSATPLEAMAMGKPLFASDRPFNRDICQNHAIYFDPLSAEDASAKIACMFKEGSSNAIDASAAREHALTFSSPTVRAEKYLALLTRAEISL